MLGCGADVSGTVVSCPGCTRLKPGDEVWTLANPAYSEYVVAEGTKLSCLSHLLRLTTHALNTTHTHTLTHTIAPMLVCLPTL